eukprot:Sspe_Gene.100516::Locus_75215_Transcript_1_2_Confidence_0.833_Length_575::g.100516::m.100516
MVVRQLFRKATPTLLQGGRRRLMRPAKLVSDDTHFRFWRNLLKSRLYHPHMTKVDTLTDLTSLPTQSHRHLVVVLYHRSHDDLVHLILKNLLCESKIAWVNNRVRYYTVDV